MGIGELGVIVLIILVIVLVTGHAKRAANGRD